MDFYNSRPRGEKEVSLPGSIPQCGGTRQFLWSELEKAKRADLTHDCRRDTCTGCGVCQKLNVKIIDWKETEA